jgi:RsiW-degrading membrane proteinase PrsW (M82 family)
MIVLKVDARRADNPAMHGYRLTSMLLAIAVVGTLAVSALVPALGDYRHDAAAPLDHLAGGDLGAFLADQPLMGLVSLLLRAPVVALVRLFDSGMLTEYRAGAIPCVLAGALLGVVLARRMAARGAATALQAAVVVALAAAGPVVYDSLVYGHPEEPLGAALCVGALLAARDSRPILGGVLLGLAMATKQWAIMAFLPVVLAAPVARVRLGAVAIGVAAVLTVPPMLADLGDYMAMQKGAAGAGGGVSPANLWWPFSPTRHIQVFDGVAWVTVEDRWLPGHLMRVPHPLLVLVGFAVSALFWLRERRGHRSLDPMALLALVFLIRCMLDPLTNVYYHAPFLFALLAWETERRRGMPLLTLLASAVLWFTWNTVAGLHEPALTNAVYLAWALPMTALLVARVFGLQSPRRRRPATREPALAAAG